MMGLEFIKLVKSGSPVSQVGNYGFFKLGVESSGGGEDLTFSRVFSENSWSTISTVSAEISANNMTSSQVAETYGWNIGDTIDITLTTGEVIQMRIIGFNHDNLSDGSGKAGITLEMVSSLNTAYKLNSTETVRPYTSTTMYTTTLPTIKATLPEKCQNIIKLVDKTTYGTISSMDLFLLSEKELTNSNSFSSNSEGDVYEYWKYKTSSDMIKHNTSTSWWLRTSFSSKAQCIVNGTGVLYKSNGNAMTARGLSFAFCV